MTMQSVLSRFTGVLAGAVLFSSAFGDVGEVASPQQLNHEDAMPLAVLLDDPGVRTEPRHHSATLRSNPVLIDRRLKEELASASDRLIDIDLFPDVRFRLSFDQYHAFSENRFSWTGRHGEGGGDWFVLSVVEDTMTATFWTADGRIYEILPLEGDVYVAMEVEGEALLPCANCAGAAENKAVHCCDGCGGNGARTEYTGRSQQDDGSVIDVMIVYTPAAMNAAGGQNAIQSLAQSSITSTNNVYANSQIDTRLELVYLGLVNYQESGNISTDLNRLRGTSDGFMDEVHGIRNDVNADLVALLSVASDFCGVAYLMTNLSTGFASNAFSVTAYQCAVSNLTFAHELGHNMGCAHDRNNAGTALFPYSYGHRWTTTGGQLRRSVMAYSPGTRRPFFSNPNVIDGGAPTGVPNSEDNARSINEAAFTIANFRISTPPPPPPPPPGAFGLLTPTEGANDVDPDVFFSMTWEAADGAAGYTVRIARDNGMTDLVVGPVQRSSPNITIFPGTFEPATTYYWSVIASNANPETTPSTPSVGSFSTVGFDVPCPGDVNGDGVVDLADFNILAVNFGIGPGAIRSQGDLNDDGFVDLADFNILAVNFGTSCD